jgi:hypothetical protein
MLDPSKNHKHPGLVSRFFQGHQVLNLTRINQQIIIFASIIEDNKVLGILGTSSWVD